MRRNLISLAIAATVSGLIFGPAAASATNGADDARDDRNSGRDASTGRHTPLMAVGLVGGTQLVTFRTNNPGKVTPIGTVTGLTGGDTRLVGIDFRVQDGNLYGIGNMGGIYILSTSDAAARFVQRLTVALEGTLFGVDFNPAANALRVVSDTGQNLRQPLATPNAATVVDGRLSTPPAVGDTRGVTAAAYTNNDTDPATATTLYDINTTANTVVIQSPANAGTLSATGMLTVDAAADAGFDIYSTVRSGTTVRVKAFATLSVDGQRGLYEITLFTGRATLVGSLGAEVTDLAFPLNQL